MEQPRLGYAVYADAATTDPVLLAVAIRKDNRVVSLEVAIPKARYDGMALLELVEKWGSTDGPELAVIRGSKDHRKDCKDLKKYKNRKGDKDG
jgi:hypothetical protein